MSKTRERNAIHSGIGDNDDLFVKRPVVEDVTEDFQYAARLRGKKRHSLMVYPEVPFQYGISYKGETLETYNEKDYKYDINAHPEKILSYRIEESKESPVQRLWEAKACFEAEVIKRKMEYAFNYKGHTGKKDKRTAEYAVNWEGEYTVKNHGDVKDLFTNTRGQYIGYNDGQTTWRMNSGHVDDALNRSFFSGTIAKKDEDGKNMYSWNAYEASFTFKPILNNGAGIFGNTKRYNWSTHRFYSAGKWDDDIVGLIFQAKDNRNFYMMMWESDERIWGSSRAGNNLDGINIFSMKDEYVDRSVTAAGSPPTHAQWVNYCNNSGWGKKHRRIYKVTNGVIRRVNVADKSSGKGWVMNSMHRIRVVTTGKNVKIYGRTSSSGSEELMFNFNADWDHGTFGMFNVSQSVEFHGIEIIEKKIIKGRIPESGWNSSGDSFKRIADHSITYVKRSDSFKQKLPSGVSADRVNILDITSNIRNPANGSIKVNGLRSSIVVQAKDYTTWKSYSGRYPRTGWLTYDGIANEKLTSNAQSYIREKTGISDLVLESITSSVKDQKAGKIAIHTNTGPITLYSSNPKDAGEKYSECYVRCGIVEVTPDNRDYRTGLLVFDDIAKVFKDDYKKFFNRSDLTNRKTSYELLKPVKKPPPDLPEEEQPSEGCVIEPVAPPEEKPVITCWDDFDFDGKKLVMWSCEFPLTTTEKLFEEKLYAYKGWTIFEPLKSFTANKWTVYKLIPIEATINPAYDEVKWVGRKDLANAPAGTKVMARTKEWYKAKFPADILNKGIVTSDVDIIWDIPPAPEHFFHPTRTSERMPDSFKVVHYLLDAFDNNSDVVAWFESKPTVTTETVDKSPESLAKVGQVGMPVIMTSNDNDRVVIHCKEDPRNIPWSSGKYIGYGKLNGKRPFWGAGAGKADMVNVSTQVVFFPENLIADTLEGPFIDMYDVEFPDFPRVRYKLHSDGKLVDFYTNHMDAHIWYTDWYSKWVAAKPEYQATMQDITQIDSPLDLDPTSSAVSADYDPDDTTIERIEVTSNNPFVKIWIEEDKGPKNGLLGTYYQFPLSANIYEDSFQVKGDYKEWLQTYTIENYMDRIEIPIKSDLEYKILDVKIDKNLIKESSTNGWILEDGKIKLKGTGLMPGTLIIRYSTGDIENEFYLEADGLGSHIEVYVNDELIDSQYYSFNKRTMTISKEKLFLHDWVKIQSYDLNDLHDPTRQNYLGDKKYSQLDFQEDAPSQSSNPNYNDPYYEGSFCFNWGYNAPQKLIPTTTTKASADFSAKYWYPDEMNFKFNVDMEIVYPIAAPVDITNFTGEWKQWDQDPNKQGLKESGEWTEGMGDWHGPPEAGFTRVTNKINQTPYSGWYNPKHVDITDYEVALTARSETDWDNDMYGMTFRWDPTIMSGYTFEWDSGGAGVYGMAIYKVRCTNPEAIGTTTPLKFSKVQLAHDPEWWDPNSTGSTTPNRILYDHRIHISAIGSEFKVYVDNRLKLQAKDESYKKGAWGPITRSNPNTYFWDFWMQTYKRVTYKDYPSFRKPYEVTKDRPVITDPNKFMIDLEIDPTDMEVKFNNDINYFLSKAGIQKYQIVSTEYFITEDKSDYEVYFKEFQRIRVLELTPDVLAPNPQGRTSIQEAVRKFGDFDISKEIVITQDIYSNWNKYKVEDFDVITFTPADCNANFDIVSDEMMDFIREFKYASDKVVVMTHDTGVVSPIKRFKELLGEFGFTLSTGVPFTRGNKIKRVDDTFNYPYDLAGEVTTSVSHWNQISGGSPIYKFTHEDRAWLSYINNVYYSEAGDSLYRCDGSFNQQLSDNEMKIWINLMCRIAQWKAETKPKMTKFGPSKLYATVRGQNPPLGEPLEKPVATPPKPEIPPLEPPLETKPTDGFTITWNGYIYAPATGLYRFNVKVNDGFRLWVDRKIVIGNWQISEDPYSSYDGSVHLEGGKWYPINAHYFENVGQAMIELRWAMPGKKYERISPNYLTPYLGYKLYAQVKKARPLPWNPRIHNGYYYHEERENYLYAQKTVQTKTPNALNEITISPRPQQGSAIIVRDNEGNNLRKVTFYDDNWNLTLENKEVFNGNSYAKYYLNYKGIDKATLKVKKNGITLSAGDFIFNEEESFIEFMEEIPFEDTIEVRYKLHYSYYIDMNSNSVNGIVNSDTAKIRLHSNYTASKMTDMEIIYEAAKQTPFYRASEVVFNPILNHNHTGFLYISESGEQDVKDLNVYLSEKTLSSSGKEYVLLTVKVVDKYGNPTPNKLVDIYRDGSLVKSKLSTNAAGEVYFYDKPVPTKQKVSTYQVRCEDIVKEEILNYYIQNKKERMYVEMVAPKLSLLGGVKDEVTIDITLRDAKWNPASKGKVIKVEKRDSKGVTSSQTYSTDAYGQIHVKVSGEKEQHGNIMIKASYDMVFEEAANYVHLKVIGG
ncbi:hypothetical protein LAV82_22955 [Bacillus sp. ILBB4]|nr:hypothetical protein [Bacillus sp. ILBB4]